MGHAKKYYGARSAAALIASVTAIGLTACGSSGGSASGSGGAALQNVTIMVSAPLATIIYLPTVLAQSLGYYKKEGLNVTVESVAGGADAAISLLSGSVDVVTGNYDHTIQLAAKGQTIEAFAQMTDSPGLILAAAPKDHGKYKSVADLKGATIGVSSPGGGSDILLRYLLARAGVPFSDVHEVSIGLGTTAVAAMEKGEVDAAVMLDPAYAQLVQQVGAGKVDTIADLRLQSTVPQYFGVASVPAGCFYSTPGWLAAHPTVAKELSTALSLTLAWIGSHTGAQIAAKLPASYAGGQPAVFAEALNENKPGFATTTKITSAGATAILKMMSAVMTTTGINLTKTYTNEYDS
jgi:NitT/TauT family transport system substrate-binding protein